MKDLDFMCLESNNALVIMARLRFSLTHPTNSFAKPCNLISNADISSMYTAFETLYK